MRAQRTNGTGPELVVRAALRRLGLARRRVRGLPGKPDAVVGRTALFVHGCFWHACERCGVRSPSGPNARAWREKFERNKARDARVVAELRSLGWEVLVVWEHETRDLRRLESRLARHFRREGRGRGGRTGTIR